MWKSRMQILKAMSHEELFFVESNGSVLTLEERIDIQDEIHRRVGMCEFPHVNITENDLVNRNCTYAAKLMYATRTQLPLRVAGLVIDFYMTAYEAA